MNALRQLTSITRASGAPTAQRDGQGSRELSTHYQAFQECLHPIGVQGAGANDLHTGVVDCDWQRAQAKLEV